MPTKSLGERHNNYLNAKNNPADPWADADGKPSKSDANGHAIFSHPKYGVRAGIINLRSYFFKHDRRTVSAIIHRWAPASDTQGSIAGGKQNDPVGYAKFVAGSMGIDPHQRLEIFDEDRSIGNLAQLRGLFYAMAANECGGNFKVPDAHFNAGVELLEPGITKTGTESTYDTSHLDAVAATEAKQWEIAGSVGAGGTNDENDVKAIQEMLRNVAMLLGDPAVDPKALDGEIVSDPKNSDTVAAIMAFQGRFMVKPDGLIEPGGRTLRELTGVLINGPQVDEGVPIAGPASGKFFFPLAKVPKAAWDWATGMRRFGANRADGKRAHAGCDLYAPAGTTIYAVADGKVTRGPEYFYLGTYALEVDHGDFVVRYGEIEPGAKVKVGQSVRAGQPIARIGHLENIDVPSDMLHFEMYSKAEKELLTLPLTVPLAQSLRAPDGRPYLRRKDLIDPTAKLKAWTANLPGGAAPAAPAPAVIGTTPQGIPKEGFTIHLHRKTEQKRAGESFARTVGSYQCYWNGVAIADVPGLAGEMAERQGPGDNDDSGDDYNRRIEKGTYPLSVHYGANYRTTGYDPVAGPRSNRKPGILLQKTEERTWILIHPGKDYFSSVGCLNPTAPMANANAQIGFNDSRARTIAIIEEMRKRMDGNFPSSGTIPGAYIVITGLA